MLRLGRTLCECEQSRDYDGVVSTVRDPTPPEYAVLSGTEQSNTWHHDGRPVPAHHDLLQRLVQSSAPSLWVWEVTTGASGSLAVGSSRWLRSTIRTR